MHLQEVRARLNFGYNVIPLERAYLLPSAIHPDTTEDFTSKTDTAFRARAKSIRLEIPFIHFPIHNFSSDYAETKLSETMPSRVSAKDKLLECVKGFGLSALAKLATLRDNFGTKNKK